MRKNLAFLLFPFISLLQFFSCVLDAPLKKNNLLIYSTCPKCNSSIHMIVHLVYTGIGPSIDHSCLTCYCFYSCVHRNTCWKFEQVFSKMGKAGMQWQTTLQCEDYEGSRKPAGTHGKRMLVRLERTTHATFNNAVKLTPFQFN